MRFQKLGFSAFGPFTGLELDLSGGAPGGFHMVFGRNEAGKSSALRGVHHLLFGFPERTQDDHVHPSRDLRIRAMLAGEAGGLLDVQRLKKRKDSLRDAADAPLDESVLSELLGGVDAQVFERLFGLDHERLRQAGEALLEDRGDVGESLFDAGSGGRGIRRVLDELKQGADEIFKGRSSKASLNVLLDGYKEARSKTRDAMIAPEKWLAQKQKLLAERARLSELSARRKGLREEQNEKIRLDGVLPLIAQCNALREKLSALGAVPTLPEDARERRLRALRTLDEASHQSARLEREAMKKRERLAALEVPENLLGVSAEAIKKLRDRVGRIRAAEEDLPRRQEEVLRREAELRPLVGKLYPGRSLDSLEALRPTATELSQVRRLPQQYAQWAERIASTQRALRLLDVDLAQIREKLAQLPEVHDLGVQRRVLSAARAKVHVTRSVREADAAALRLEREAQSKLSALGLWQGTLEALPALALPQEETIARFQSEFSALAAERDELSRATARATQQLLQNAQKIGAIERSGSVPSEGALGQARARRDDGLRRMLAAWSRGESSSWVDPEFLPGLTLAEGFEQALTQADEHADRLRREAERVSALAALSAEREQLSIEQAALALERAAHEERLSGATIAWHNAWKSAAIEPASPSEMRGWLDRQQALCEFAARLADARRSAEQARAEQVEVVAELARALGRQVSEGSALEPMLAACEEAVEAGTLAAQKRVEQRELLSKSEQRKAELVHELAAQQQALELWHREWRAATARLGLPEDLPPDEIGPLLDAVSELYSGLDQLSAVRRRTVGMERDRAEFEAHVSEWLKTYAPDLLERAADMAAEELARRFQAAEHHRQESAQILADLAETASELSALEVRAEQAGSELEGLRVAAQARDLGALVAIEDRAAEAGRLSREFGALEGALLTKGGVPLEELVEQARGVERAALQVRLRELEEELPQLDEEILDLSAQVRDLEHGLLRYAEADAADRAQELTEQAAEIRDQALRYARLRLASVVLEREVERYREQNQGPVLKRANALFPRLTLGSFRGLRAGAEERTIVLVRDDGKEVSVEGLSEGARYQLYLALRIASLERYLERNPPLPLVLDDILIHFDDERAAAALGVLGELAERVQILFFTHHARDLSLAAGVIPEGRLFRHALSGPMLK